MRKGNLLRAATVLWVCGAAAGSHAATFEIVVSDWYGDRLARIEPDSLGYRYMTTTGAGGLDNPTGLAVAHDGGTLLVGSGWTNDVRRFDLATGAYIGVFAQNAQLPILVNTGADHDLYVASRDGEGVFVYDGTSGALKRSYLNHDHGQLWWAFDVEFLPDGDLLVSSFETGTILRFDGATAQFEGTFSPRTNDYAAGMAWGPDGNLYVARYHTNRIDRIHGATGEVLGTFASGNGLVNPVDLAFTPDGRLFVVSERSPDISIFNGVTGAAAGLIDLPGSAGTGHSAILVIPESGGGALVLALLSAVLTRRARRSGRTGRGNP